MAEAYQKALKWTLSFWRASFAPSFDGYRSLYLSLAMLKTHRRVHRKTFSFCFLLSFKDNRFLRCLGLLSFALTFDILYFVMKLFLSMYNHVHCACRDNWMVHFILFVNSVIFFINSTIFINVYSKDYLLNFKALNIRNGGQVYIIGSISEQNLRELEWYDEITTNTIKIKRIVWITQY